MMRGAIVGLLLFGLNGPAAADRVNETVIGTNPLLAAGERALRAGDYAQGLRLILDGSRSDVAPHDRSGVYNNLCAGYVGVRRYAEALAACDRSRAFRAQNWRVFNNRALALLGLGRIAAARADVERGLALHPGSPTLARVAALIEEREIRRLVAAEQR